MSILSTKNTISIDFGTDEIKVVEGKYSKKGIVISKNFAVPVPREVYIDGEIQDMDQFAYLFRNALLENKVSQGDAYGVINSTKVIMRDISIPKVEEKQIESILSYQLSDYLPVNPEDYVVKFINLGTKLEDGIERLNILLIGVPRIIVESHLNLFKNVGLKPAVLDYAANAINKLINFGESINNFYDNKETIACIELGYESTSLTITQEGVIKVSRVNELGAKNILMELQNRFNGLSEQDLITKISEIEDINEEFNPLSDEYNLAEGIKSSLGGILDSIEMIFRYFKTREIGNDIGLIILHGGMLNINGIEKLFSNYYDYPCVKIDSLSKVKFSGDLSKYANAIGGLIRLSEV